VAVLFPLGRIVATPGAIDLIRSAGQDLLPALLERTNFHLRLRLFALQKVGDEFVESIPVLEHEPVPALPEDVHLHVRQAC
jgi:hypothetical protein